jgi:hypothetical protein
MYTSKIYFNLHFRIFYKIGVYKKLKNFFTKILIKIIINSP